MKSPRRGRAPGRRRASGRGALLAAVLLGMLPVSVAAQPQNWALGADLDLQPRCALFTPEQTIDDGHGETRVRLILDDRRLLVKTDSNIDGEFGDLGLVVDDAGFIPADRISDETDLVFESRLESMIRDFIAGYQLRVQFRFWPTWPSQGLRSAEFSLLGFTRAHGRMAQCRE